MGRWAHLQALVLVHSESMRALQALRVVILIAQGASNLAASAFALVPVERRIDRALSDAVLAVQKLLAICVVTALATLNLTEVARLTWTFAPLADVVDWSVAEWAFRQAPAVVEKLSVTHHFAPGAGLSITAVFAWFFTTRTQSRVVEVAFVGAAVRMARLLLDPVERKR
jgi:hypothetical protein